MDIVFETERLFFRELLPSDDLNIFELDSNPEVHRFLGNKPITTIEQSRDYIVNVRGQYERNGIGRQAAILKDTGEFIGWAGLKLEHNVNGHDQFYDIGYRFIQKYWHHGYASEAARFFADYGFNVLKLPKINASAIAAHTASRRVLEKTGLHYVENFDYDGEEAVWYEMVNPNLKG